MLISWCTIRLIVLGVIIFVVIADRLALSEEVIATVVWVPMLIITALVLWSER